jgi:hypothetical protein
MVGGFVSIVCRWGGGGGCAGFFWVSKRPVFTAQCWSWDELFDGEDFVGHDDFSGELRGFEEERDCFQWGSAAI